jgi:hypothetical protein
MEVFPAEWSRRKCCRIINGNRVATNERRNLLILTSKTEATNEPSQELLAAVQFAAVYSIRSTNATGIFE